jgi:AcrR family transcriptional regulator
MSMSRAEKRLRRRSDGERTHAAILEEATRIASVEGIHGLTLGRLAEALGVSKSGLYAHFGSKEQLQLETIEAAAAIFEREVIQPIGAVAPGIARIDAFGSSYLSYVERRVFPGGCFFASLLAEVDARTGPLHELVVSIEQASQDKLVGLIEVAISQGEIAAEVEPRQLAFELQAVLELANYHHVLFADPAVLSRGRAAFARILNASRASGR